VHHVGSGQKNCYIYLDTVLQSLARTLSLSCSINLHRHTTFAVVILTFSMFEPHVLIAKLVNWLVPDPTVPWFIHFSFSFFQFKTTRPAKNTRFRSDFTVSSFAGQVSLPCIRHLFTQLTYNLFFNFNENLLPVNMELLHAVVTLIITTETHPL